jgi:NitT/TauT family transport system permease protein
MKGPGKKLIWTLLGIGTLIFAWHIGSQVAGNDLLFPGPGAVLKRWIALIPTEEFRQALIASFWRTLLGMGIAGPLGVGIGLISGLDSRGGAFFRPLFMVIGATPVMSVILIAFLALGSERTPIFTAFLMVFPVMTANTIEGLHGIDPRLKELFAAYALPRRDALRYLYLPGIAPFVLGGLRSALSLCWKAVVAAEVLVQPLRALGTGMQRAKAQLETPDLFAWTLAAVSAAGVSQYLLTLLLKFCRPSSGFGKAPRQDIAGPGGV